MTIRKPVDYPKIAKRLTAQRRGGIIAPPSPSVPSRRSDAICSKAQEPALELSSYKGTRSLALEQLVRTKPTPRPTNELPPITCNGRTSEKLGASTDGVTLTALAAPGAFEGQYLVLLCPLAP